MRNLIRFAALVFCVALLLTAGSALAGQRDAGVPHRYNPNSLDGSIVQIEFGGVVWSAWAYRNGAEYDIAVSYRGAGGYWSEPLFFGRNNGRNEMQPALTVDPFGRVVLAYSDRTDGSVKWTVRGLHGLWTAPVNATADGERGDMPSLSVLGDQLIVAFRSGMRIELRRFQLPVVSTSGGELDGGTAGSIADGPDPFGYGNWDDPPDDDPKGGKKGGGKGNKN